MATKSEVSVTVSNLQVLDCKVCNQFLTIPVFQCKAGHTACESCRKTLESKCATCGLAIDSECCHLEEIIKSLTLPCKNKDYGCKEIISYCNTKNHANHCVYECYPCPKPACDFKGLSSQLSDHFCDGHPTYFKTFYFNRSFELSLMKGQTIYMLKEAFSDDVFVVSNETTICGGRKIFVSFVSLTGIISDNEVKVEVTVGDSDYKFSGPTPTARSISDKSQPPALLYISSGVFDDSPWVEFKISD